MSFLCCPLPSLSRRESPSAQPNEIHYAVQTHGIARKSSEIEKTLTFRTTGTSSSVSTALDQCHFGITTIDIKDLLEEVQRLESRYSKLARHRNFALATEQIVQFCRKFASSADILAQCGSGWSQLVWGCLRALLTCAETSIARFYLIRSSVRRIGGILSISEQFEAAFVNAPRVRDASQLVYGEIYEFLRRILQAVTKKAWQRILQSATRPFDYEFQENASNLQTCMQNLRDEIQIEHIRRMEKSQMNLISGVSRTITTTESLISHVVLRRNSDLSQAITHWLDPVGMIDDFDRARRKRTPGTGLWLLRHDKYTRWKNSSSAMNENILAILGRPGSGKTVLAATIVDEIEEGIRQDPLQDTRPITAYFFCHAAEDNKRGRADIYATFLAQIITQLPDMPSALVEIHDVAVKYGHTKRTDKYDLAATFAKVANTLPELFVILDGLDECEDAVTIVGSLTELAQKLSSVRLWISSRPLQPCHHVFKKATQIVLDPETLKSDVDLFISHELRSLSTHEHLRQEAFLKLSSASSGMFLYASLGVQAMKTAVHPQSLSKALGALPEGVNGLYAGLLKRLSQQSGERRDLARHIFMWVCCSQRLLSWPELECVLSWTPATLDFAIDRRPFKAVVLELCSPLVEYQEDRDVFMVSHHSVSDFLTSSGWDLELSVAEQQFLVDTTYAHGLISKILLCNLKDSTGVSQIQADSLRDPLAAYATANWCSHLVLSDAEDEALRRQANLFLDDWRNRLAYIMRFILSNKDSMPLQSLMKHQKACREWLQQSQVPATYCVDDLIDVQGALLALDRLPASTNVVYPVSNFERLQYIRDLVRAFNMAGELPKGISLFDAALRATQNLDGPDAASTVWLLNALGLLYDQQHLTERAVEMQLRALSIQERQMACDLDLVNTINELGRLNRHAGRYRESEQFHNRALAILGSILPETDPQVIWTTNTLGRCLQKSGRAREALPLHNRALDVQNRVLGPDHPHAIWTLGDIARCQRDLGDIPRAVETLQEALERRSRVLGPKHPDTLWTINDLGLLFEEMGDPDTAVEFHSRAYDGQVEVLGVSHSHTVWSLDKTRHLRPA